jgi:hypothetical protein
MEAAAGHPDQVEIEPHHLSFTLVSYTESDPNFNMSVGARVLPARSGGGPAAPAVAAGVC